MRMILAKYGFILFAVSHFNLLKASSQEEEDLPTSTPPPLPDNFENIKNSSVRTRNAVIGPDDEDAYLNADGSPVEVEALPQPEALIGGPPPVIWQKPVSSPFHRPPMDHNPFGFNPNSMWNNIKKGVGGLFRDRMDFNQMGEDYNSPHMHPPPRISQGGGGGGRPPSRYRVPQTFHQPSNPNLSYGWGQPIPSPYQPPSRSDNNFSNLPPKHHTQLRPPSRSQHSSAPLRPGFESGSDFPPSSSSRFPPEKSKPRPSLSQQEPDIEGAPTNLKQTEIAHKASSNSSVPPPRTVSKSSSTSTASETPICDFYTPELCLEVSPYPTKLIREIMNREFQSISAMYVDIRDLGTEESLDGVSGQEEEAYTFEHYYGTSRDPASSHSHRDYGPDGGYICPSDVQYAHPQRAMNPAGIWKYIINTKDYTQTVRVEKCLKAESKCSYVFNHLQSRCLQVYNYQRLLAFDNYRGIHVDIFKIPTSCSCHLRPVDNQPVSKRNTTSADISIKPTTKSQSGRLKHSTTTSRNEKAPPKIRRPVVTQPNSPRTGGPLSSIDGEEDDELALSSSHKAVRVNNGELPYSRPTSVGARNYGSRVEADKIRQSHSSKAMEDESDSDEERINYNVHPVMEYIKNYKT